MKRSHLQRKKRARKIKVRNLESLANNIGLKHVCGDLSGEICGCYAGDLLSWVMSHAQYGDVWITIMSNLNVVAVASLTECACVIMAEGVYPDDDVIKVANEKGITIFSDSRSTFELCCLVGQYLKENE